MFRLLTTSFLMLAIPLAAPAGPIAVELYEGVPDKRTWDFQPNEPTERYTEPAFAFVAVPRKYSARGMVLDRSNPFVVRAEGEVALPAGEYRLLLRARNAARLTLDGRVVLQTEFIKLNANGHESVPEQPAAAEPGLCTLAIAHQEKLATVKIAEGKHTFRLEAFIGGQKCRADVGEVLAGIAGSGERFRLLGSSPAVRLDPAGWTAYTAATQERHRVRDVERRRLASAEETKYWDKRHEIARREWANKPATPVPDVSATTPIRNDIDRFVGKRLEEKKTTPSPLTDDLVFLRRVTLDTVGVIPSRAEIEAFLNDKRPDRRERVIERLLADPRWADNWVGYWQDVLAENPGILKPTLNNTGPFRWWLHAAFLDNLPMDRFVTELVRMEGSTLGGSPAGFGMASQNDAPMAAKAHVLAKGFLALEMQCARCHDAPHHPFAQKDLFSLAAMLGKAPQTLPVTSTVRVQEGGRKPAVTISLKPGEKIAPTWAFKEYAPSEIPEGVLREGADPREKLAAILTSPRNERFAQVLVNRLWKRYLGLGLVEPVDDWNEAEPSHPALLEYLARALITHNYDLKHVARLILNSHAYQRVVQPAGSQDTGPEERLFASPARRRLSAEQLVDSLFSAAGKEFGCEELTMDPEGRRPITEMLNLGAPKRAWELTSLSNERDRPALAMPMAQGIVDLLTAYGWRDSRPNPLTVRDETPTPLQPLVLANGIVGTRIARLCDESVFTTLALEDRPLPDLARAIFLQVLSRAPTADELRAVTALLQPDYADRRVPGEKAAPRRLVATTGAVSWSNHLSPEATRIKLEMERAARAGDPPTRRLRGDWRERMEDVIWGLVNSPEFVFVP